MKKLLCMALAMLLVVALAACGAKTEPVKTNTPAVEESEILIFTVIVQHADGETSTNRLSTDCETLAEALLARKYMTEDMLTVDGEKADPEKGAYWNLYIDGIATAEKWDAIVLENGAEYMFEYTVEDLYGTDIEGTENPEGTPEEEPTEDVEIPEEAPTEPEIEG